MFGKIPGSSHVVNLVNKGTGYQHAGIIAKGVALYEIQKKVPGWGEIIGTSVPSIRTKEFILYVSEDGKEWPNRVSFTLKPDGELSAKTWQVK